MFLVWLNLQLPDTEVEDSTSFSESSIHASEDSFTPALLVRFNQTLVCLVRKSGSFGEI